MRKILKRVLVLLAILAALGGTFAAAPAYADGKACSQWREMRPGIWVTACILEANGRTDAWAEMRNLSNYSVMAEMWVFMKDEPVPHRLCGTGVGQPVLPGQTFYCDPPQRWRWVAPPRWARAFFNASQVTLWVNTPQLP